MEERTPDLCQLHGMGKGRRGRCLRGRMCFRKSENNLLILGADKRVPTLISWRGGQGHPS